MHRISFPEMKKLLPGFLTAAVFLAIPILALSEVPDRELAAVRNTGKTFVRISRKITPSVVNIRTYRTVSPRRYGLSKPFFGEMFDPFREFFGKDFGDRFKGPDDGANVQTGLGSGVIVRPEGVVLTNNHVIEGAEKIMVTLHDRTELPAQIVGSDRRTDIAVLKLPKGHYPSAPLGDSDAIEIGEWAIAIGNPFGLGQSVTAGIVSAKGRANVGVTDLEDFIQTDAAINPGNSGGPLINLDGEVIGINTAIFSRSGGYQGIGFAVPSNLAAIILDSLFRTGRVVRSDLGVRVQDATEAILLAAGAGVKNGVIVTEVLSGGVADRAGVKRGDVLVRVKGRPVMDAPSFYRIVSLLPVEERIPVVLFRGGVRRTLLVKVGELPERPIGSDVRIRTALGFTVEDLTEKLAEQLGYRYERGVLVTRVFRGSQAEATGVEPGDLIVRVNGDATPDLSSFRKRFEAVQWGQKVVLDLKREGRSLKVKMFLRK